MVMIGIDPHKRTHTAVAIETASGCSANGSCTRVNARCRSWWRGPKRLDGGDRVWAIESAGGLGYLLAQQLLAAGEHGGRHPGDVGVAGEGCWARAGRRRTTRTTHGRSRSRRCGHRQLVPVRVEDHATVLRLVGATTHPAGVDLQQDGLPAACAARASWCRAGSAKNSLFPKPDRCSRSSSRSARSRRERHVLAVEMLDELERLDVQRKTRPHAHPRRGRRVGDDAHGDLRGR